MHESIDNNSLFIVTELLYMSIIMTKIKHERLNRGWNQQTLGFRAKVAASDVSRIENCRMIPSPSQAERLAKVLGLRPDELQEPATEKPSA